MPEPRKKRRTQKQRKKSKNIKKNVFTAFFMVVIAVLTYVSGIFAAVRDWLDAFDKRVKRAVVSTVCAVVIIAASVGVYAFLTRTNGYEVYFNDVIVGIIEMPKSEGAVDEYIIGLAVERAAAEAGEPVECLDRVSVVGVHSKDFVTMDHIVSEIYKRLTYKIRAAVITVDGERIAVVRNENEAESILDGIQQEYYQAGLNITESGFVETVDIAIEYVDPTERMTNARVTEILKSKTLVQEYYTAQSGDILSGIAARHSMTLDALLSLNPEISPTGILSIGTVLLVTRPRPLLSVYTVEPATYIAVVPYEKQTKTVSTQPKSYSQITQQGRDGQEEISELITRINGAIESREIIGRRSILEPVTEITEVGTQ